MIYDELEKFFEKAENSDGWTDEDGVYHSLVEEIENFFYGADGVSSFSVDSTTAFDSPGCTAGVISIAWIEQGELKTLNAEWERT